MPWRPPRVAGDRGARALSDRLTHVRRTRTMRKHECMIQYHLARMPMYGAHESPQYAKANELRDNIKAIEAKARERWERGHL